MGKPKDSNGARFQLEGRFLSFVVEGGYKLKRLWLATSEGERCIKLSKESRASVKQVLMPGDWLQVSGHQKTDWKTGEVKLKADIVTSVSPRQMEAIASARSVTSKTRASILVCQKSDCMKRGGKAVCQALSKALDDRGLSGEVAIKGTGCMKHCKSGPNIVFMPDKTRYSRIRVGEMPALIDKHFSPQ